MKKLVPVSTPVGNAHLLGPSDVGLLLGRSRRSIYTLFRRWAAEQAAGAITRVWMATPKSGGKPTWHTTAEVLRREFDVKDVRAERRMSSLEKDLDLIAKSVSSLRDRVSLLERTIRR